jgi:hypothetical protein
VWTCIDARLTHTPVAQLERQSKSKAHKVRLGVLGVLRTLLICVDGGALWCGGVCVVCVCVAIYDVCAFSYSDAACTVAVGRDRALSRRQRQGACCWW